jgi:hypothetical protein
MSSSPETNEKAVVEELPAGVPVFDEDGALSREFLLDRGYCCGNGCRNCPYESVDEKELKPSKQS